MNCKLIPTGELFADLQVSMTEIELIKLLPHDEYKKIMEDNYKFVETIKTILRERFSDDEIRNFLKNGYPRCIS